MLDATTIDGVTWAGRAGTGPDVLFLGGPLDDAASLRPLLRELESAHRVTAFDPRGSGLGITPQAPPSVEELVGDALTVLREADVARAHVVGASLGGLVAQRLALDHPDRVESLVLSGSWARSDRFLRGVLREWAMAAERARSVDELRTHLALWTEGRAPIEQAQRLAHILMLAARQIAEAMPRLRRFGDIRHSSSPLRSSSPGSSARSPGTQRRGTSGCRPAPRTR